jgi:hypothetical protein
MRTRSRVILFTLVCVACLVVPAAYFLAVVRGRQAEARTAPPVPQLGPAAASSLTHKPHLIFRSTALGDTYGRVAVVPLRRPSAPRAVTPLSCERVDFAAGHGICLQADRGAITTYKAVLFDDSFKEIHELSLAGAPSRARMSPDGELAANTVFVTGHSYAQAGFSTRTAIVDVRTGRELGELEQFTVLKDGKVIRSVDFNFWGVTFARDHDRFYATLGTRGQTYLVEGNVPKAQVRVIREGVECPSLSPDGTRIAFKQRSGGLGPVTWQAAVLDLRSLDVTPLAEERSVDDQIEWLDNENVLYGLGEGRPGESSAVTDVWSVPANGSGQPRKVLEGAWSPGAESVFAR